MNINLKTKFKLLYLIGVVLLFTSLFLDWYYFQAFDGDDKLIAYWSYNPFTEWSTFMSGDNRFNNLVEPQGLSMPLAITVLFIIALLSSGYSVLFKDPEHKEDLEKLYPYSYLNFLLLVLNLFYIFAFPVFYLLSDDLYFPFLIIEDRDMNITYYYSIGPGYLLQVIGFIMIFPYTLFYYQTIDKFKSKEHSPKRFIERYVQQVQDPLDLDKLIAKEQLNLKFDDLPQVNEEYPFDNQIRIKRRK